MLAKYEWSALISPAGWAFCNGQLLSISENSTLFNLIGTTYGGDGQQTFGLPNLMGRIPVHQGTNPNGVGFVIGQEGGVETVTLNTNEIPVHSHSLAGQSGSGGQPSPAGGVWANSALDQFSTAMPANQMASGLLASQGGNQPHDNMPPFQVINFVISLFGIYPSQN